VEEIAVSLRAICTGLRPPMLDDLGLVAALEWLISDISVHSDLCASLLIEGVEPAGPTRVTADLEIALYRITQEALANCAKHARANHVWVTLQHDAQMIRLRVLDDGQGLGGDALDGGRPLHLGLLGMRERLRPWGGAISVCTDHSGGTVVMAEVQLGGEHERGSNTAANSGADHRRPSYGT
jgi:signal transduction histidine kinase